MVRKRLIKLWREAKAQHADPVDAWASIVNAPEKRKVINKLVVVVVSFALHGLK